jgi:tetratricopeptide (TPR) repeat protein
MFRRALAIDEVSYGPDHPEVAGDLNNLAGFLRATNRLSDAVPMYRRALAILVQLARATGHQHPKFELVLRNYVQALRELGRTKAEIDAALKSIMEDARESPP